MPTGPDTISTKNAKVEYIPAPASKKPSPGVTRVIKKVQTMLAELVSKLFLELVAAV
jgi:hypothetical protein